MANLLLQSIEREVDELGDEVRQIRTDLAEAVREMRGISHSLNEALHAIRILQLDVRLLRNNVSELETNVEDLQRANRGLNVTPRRQR